MVGKKGHGLMITQVNSVGNLVQALRDGEMKDRERFLVNGGWPMIKSWVEQSYNSKNTSVLHEIFNLILEFPEGALGNVLLEKDNLLLPVLGTIAVELRANGEETGPTAQLCVKILQQWRKIINDVKEEKGKLKKGAKVRVTDDTGRETTYQALGDDFRWWLVTSPGGSQEVERTCEEYYPAVEEVIVEEKRKLRRSLRISERKCKSPKKEEKKRRKPPPPPPIVRYTPSPSSSTEEVEEEEEKEDKVEEEEELEDKVEEEEELTVEEEQEVKEDEEMTPPQSPGSAKQTRRKYRKRRQQEIETDALTEKEMENAIQREKRLVKYRTPDLCKEEKPPWIFGRKRRLEVVGSQEGEPSEEEKEEDGDKEKMKVNKEERNEKKGKMKVEEKVEKPKKSLGVVDDKKGIVRKRNVSGGGGCANRMGPIVKLMEAIEKPLYPARKIARVLPSQTAVKEEEARKKREEEEDRQKYVRIVEQIARSPPPPPPALRLEPREKAKEDKQGNQVAVGSVGMRPGDPKEDMAKRWKDAGIFVGTIASLDPRLAARKKREEDARKKMEEEARRKIEEATRKKMEEEARRKIEEMTRRKMEEMTRKKMEEAMRRKMEEAMRRKMEEEARKKREEEAIKLIEEKEKQESMVIAIYPLPPEEPEKIEGLDIPPPVWHLRKIKLRKRRHRPVESNEKIVQEERERFAFFGDFSTDSPEEPVPKDRQPAPYDRAPRMFSSRRVLGTRVYANAKSAWPEARKDIAPVRRIIAFSSQLFPPPPLPRRKESRLLALPQPPPQVEESTKEEDKMQIVPATSVAVPTPTIQFVPFFYPVPVFPIASSSPPPLPITPPPPVYTPPPPPPEEEKPPIVNQKYNIIRIPELPKKAYIPALPQPSPVALEVTQQAVLPPPREDTPTPPPPGVDDERPISPLGPRPIPTPLPVPAPTPQQLASIPNTPIFPPSLLSLPLSPPSALYQQQQHQPSFAPTVSRPPRLLPRPPRGGRKLRRKSPLLPYPPDFPQHFINSPPTQMDYNYFNPSRPSPPPPPQLFDSPFLNSSPPQQLFDNNPFNSPSPPQQQLFDNNPFVNPPPPPSNFCNLSGYQYPGSPPRYQRF